MKDKEKYSHLGTIHTPIVYIYEGQDLTKELINRIKKECVPKHYEVIKKREKIK